MRLKLPIIITGCIIVFVLIALFAPRGANQFAVYRPGWEITADLVAFQCKNVNIDTSKIDYNHDGIIDVKDKYLSLKNPGLLPMEPNSNIEVNPDSHTYGVPELKATVTNIRAETSLTQFNAPLSQNTGNYKYIIDYHRYLFDVQIVTNAHAVMNNNNPERGQAPGPTYYWEHETAETISWATDNNKGGSCIGKDFEGGLYARFACIPWGIIDQGPIPENYTFTGYWLGVMETVVQDERYNTVQGDPDDRDPAFGHQGFVRSIQSKEGPLNMFKDDGTYAAGLAEVPWEAAKILSPDIKSTVVIFLPFDIMAGAYSEFDGTACDNWGAITKILPVNYWLQYTVRVGCFVVKEYQAADPVISPDPNHVQPPESYVPYAVPTWWDQYGLIIIIVAVVIILGLIVLSLFFNIGLIAILTGGIFRMAQPYKLHRRRSFTRGE